MFRTPKVLLLADNLSLKPMDISEGVSAQGKIAISVSSCFKAMRHNPPLEGRDESQMELKTYKQLPRSWGTCIKGRFTVHTGARAWAAVFIGSEKW